MSHNKKGKNLKPKKQKLKETIHETHESPENSVKSTHVDRSGFLHK